MNASPIPTTHNGVQFRSRLEARWAMFFDLSGIHWKYEYEGFQLSTGWFLPDFWLPHVKARSPFKNWKYDAKRPAGVFFEIKPPNGKCEHLDGFLFETGKQLLVAFGDPLEVIDIRNTQGIEVVYGDGPNSDDYGWDNLQAFARCNACGFVGLEYRGGIPHELHPQECCLSRGVDYLRDSATRASQHVFRTPR